MSIKIKLNSAFDLRIESEFKQNKYEQLNLKFNPFPMSGSTYIHSSDELTSYLEPIDDAVNNNIIDFILSSLRNQNHTEDTYQGMTIVGDYGSGKTQLLMYIKFLLETKNFPDKKPYVIYIDNPGVKVSELISAIIAEIGHSNLKKYLWNFVINELKKDIENAYLSLGINRPLTPNDDPFSSDKEASYRLFIDACYRCLFNKSSKSEFGKRWQNMLIGILKNTQINRKQDGFIAQEFFNILDDDLGITSTWDNLLHAQKSIENHEASFINAIISLLHYEGFTNVFILIDEFEDITRGRLTKQQTDNYLHTLRTLLDKERRWSVVFAMTNEAFDKIKISVPPLAERMTTVETSLHNSLSTDQATKLINNYISFAAIDDKDVYPFSLDSIKTINEIKGKNARRILSFCFQVIEKALSENTKLPISPDFINSIS